MNKPPSPSNPHDTTPWLMPTLLVAVIFAALVFASNWAEPSWLALPVANGMAETAVSATVDQANCRYGTAAIGQDHVPWIDTLGTGWYLSFQAAPFAQTPQNGAEFVHVIRVSEDKHPNEALAQFSTFPALTNGGLGALIDANPGALWLIGNEQDVSEVQDDMRPSVYARTYHTAYNFIKQRDPSAQVGIGGLSMMTPGRLQYLELVWDAYVGYFNQPMPVDVWTFHLYILSEIRPWDGGNSDGRVAVGTDPALAKKAPLNANPALCSQADVYCRAEHDSLPIFKEQIVALRTWMKAHGEQNKPLILSEYSQLYPFVDYDDPVNPTQCFLQDENGKCFTEARVNAFMNATFDYLETAVDPNLGYPNDNYRLVQQWLWFSLVVPPEHSGGSSNLLQQNYAIFAPGSMAAFTGVGLNMDSQISRHTLTVNLKASRAHAAIAKSDPISGTATVTLTADFHNNGNSSITDPFLVTFFKDPALTQVIGSQTIDPNLRGCARHTYQATTTWFDLTPGTYRYWAKIDSTHAINESKNDNVVQGVVFIDPESVYLPLVTRR